MTTNTTTSSVRIPPTGEQYLESLRDGRDVYIYGQKVKDVTTHPAFRNSARSVARLYDSLHDPALRGIVSVPTDTGNGGFTHPFFKAPKSKEDLRQSQVGIEAWQRMNYGWMGRTPDYKASFTGLFGGNREYFAPFTEAADKWYRKSQESVTFLNHAIVNPPVDRDKPIDEVTDVFVRAVKETDRGLIVQGAKVVATGSAITQGNFCAHSKGMLKDKQFALGFIVPMDTPGVKLVCRHSYEMAAAATGSPFDYPLSSRMDENDAILIFDNALIAWEDVLHYGDVERADHFLLDARMSGRVSIQAFTRLVVKLEFLIGLVAKATHLAGTSGFTTIHTLIGELVMWRNTVRGLLDAMVEMPDVLAGEYLTFNENYAMTLRGLGPTIYTRMRDIVQKACGSSLIYLNSHIDDFKSEEIRPYLDRYLRGSKGVDAMRRSKVMKLLWDSIGSEFGARHELYERHYLGGHDAVLQGPLYLARAAGDMKKFEELAEQCMSEYGIDGWNLPGFQSSEDINVTGRTWE